METLTNQQPEKSVAREGLVHHRQIRTVLCAQTMHKLTASPEKIYGQVNLKIEIIILDILLAGLKSILLITMSTKVIQLIATTLKI